jgi:hypothetical protein
LGFLRRRRAKTPAAPPSTLRKTGDWRRRQTLNFGIWRFCELQGAECVAVQEGIFYHDGLSRHGVQTVLAYKRKHSADGVTGTGSEDLVVVLRAEFVGGIFWQAVQAGALIVATATAEVWEQGVVPFSRSYPLWQFNRHYGEEGSGTKAP